MLYLLAVAPMVLGLGWAIVEGSILPRMIPRDEIERLAGELAERYPHGAEEAAFAEEHAAWCRSDASEQGKWKRVRKLLGERSD